MGLIRKLVLLAVFVGSAYCWLVLFEFGVGGFTEGLPTYYQRFMPEEEKPKSTALPGTPPPKKRPAAPVIGGPAQPAKK